MVRLINRKNLTWEENEFSKNKWKKYELSDFAKTLNTYFRFYPIESEKEYRKNIL